jgi:hypothetical protein
VQKVDKKVLVKFENDVMHNDLAEVSAMYLAKLTNFIFVYVELNYV